MNANIELARLHAALESLESSEELLRQVRQVESFRSERRELRGAAERISEAHALLRALIPTFGASR
jgi:hypothetical protein